mmetsp:Transcript_20335/g.40334  ORF Transcript_20335/g.40334 Transcript_20335/m.40334 type:complete len:232 (-) Transcript_20335:74-769(-)
MLPGKGLNPVAGSASSPPPPPTPRACSSGPSWLYSVLAVTTVPSLFVSLVMAPISCLAILGMHMEFRSSPRSLDTPSTAATERITSALVSWKNATHFFPPASHSFAIPLECSSRCTSPWPWGLVASTSGFPVGVEVAPPPSPPPSPPPQTVSASSSSTTAMSPWLLVSAATFSCFTRRTWPSARPKYPWSARRASVRVCVSSEVMITSGSGLVPAGHMLCKARMLAQYRPK